MHLLGEAAGVLVDGPGAGGHPALGDGSPDHPFVVGSENLWADMIHASLCLGTFSETILD